MLKWLNNAVFYQVYPITFYDSNGDGMGDLKGVAEKADYIKSLGVDAVWLTPIYKSPFKDGGYDVADYLAIDKRFGDMEDFDAMLKALKDKGLKVILDLVIGHTSDKHPWFKKSALAKRNKYSDYYIWTDSLFRSYDGMIYGLYYRDGGYMKNYYASQPALNYGFVNPEKDQPWQLHYKDERLRPLREELLDIMRFYLDKGVDGFRVDMAGSLIKGGAHFDECYAFDNSEEGMEGMIWFWNEVLGTLRKEYKDKVYVAEWCLPQRSIGMCGFDVDFLTHDTAAFNTLFRNEPKNNLGEYYERGYNYFSKDGKGDLNEYKKYVEWLYPILEGKGGFSSPSGSHDEIRMSTGKDDQLIKTVFAFLLLHKNVPFVYYGDEIGIEHNFSVSKDGGGIRTGTRTPMQWTKAKGQGFSAKKTTYLPVMNDAHKSVEAQEEDENSLLNTVRKLIAVKKKYKCFDLDAEQTFVETGYPAVIERAKGGETAAIYINPSDKTFERNVGAGEVLISNNACFKDGKVTLGAESFAVILKK